MHTFREFITEDNTYLTIPADWKTTWEKRSFVRAGKGAKIIFGYVPISKLKAAGSPSEVGDHVREMIKTLKKKKLQPIVVRLDGNKYEVEDGNTRVLALKVMGVTGKIPATIFTWNKAADIPNIERF